MTDSSIGGVLRVAAVQMCSGGDLAANIEAADRHVRAAAADGAKLVVLPEKWPLIGNAARLRAGAEGLDGPALRWARATASELGIDLIAGSIVERREGRPKLSNTSVHMSPDGEMKALYRKVHMFDVQVDGRSYRESEVEEGGVEIVTSKTAAKVEPGAAKVEPEVAKVEPGVAAKVEPGVAGVELGLAVCYDLRFPELFRILALKGASVIVLPSAFTLKTTRDHWLPLLRARAIENATFLIAANQAGAHPDGYHSGGRSAIVDPWGVVLACADEQEHGFVSADLDFDRQQEIRTSLPALANRREDAYHWPAEAA